MTHQISSTEAFLTKIDLMLKHALVGDESSDAISECGSILRISYDAVSSGSNRTFSTSTPHWMTSYISQYLQSSANCNRFIEEPAPWDLQRTASKREARLDAILYTLGESLRIIAILISPVLPKAAHGIFDQLNWKMELSGKEERFSLADAEWGRLPDGHVVGKPVPLFPRDRDS